MTRVIFCFLLAIQMAAPALGQEGKRVRVDLATTRQKASYLRMLVSKSVAVSTIEESGDNVARENLARTRSLVDEAGRDLAKSRVQEADRKLNRALKLLNSETRRLSKRALTQSNLVAAYEKRLHTVETFLKAYERVAGGRDIGGATLAQTESLKKFIARAQALAAAGKLNDARSVLDRAYRTARGDIKQLREGKTLVRSLNFETPEKEYHYESNRNDSHFMLLKFAVSEKKPPAVFRKRIEELRIKAAKYRSLADTRATSDNYIEAIDRLVQSTDTLLKAIRMAGLYMPG